MPQLLFLVLLFAAMTSVPVVCFATARLYSRLGIGRPWPTILRLTGFVSALGVISSLGALGMIGGSILVIALPVVLVAAVVAAVAVMWLALRPWPRATDQNGNTS